MQWTNHDFALEGATRQPSKLCVCACVCACVCVSINIISQSPYTTSAYSQTSHSSRYSPKPTDKYQHVHVVTYSDETIIKHPCLIKHPECCILGHSPLNRDQAEVNTRAH